MLSFECLISVYIWLYVFMYAHTSHMPKVYERSLSFDEFMSILKYIYNTKFHNNLNLAILNNLWRVLLMNCQLLHLLEFYVNIKLESAFAANVNIRANYKRFRRMSTARNKERSPKPISIFVFLKFSSFN